MSARGERVLRSTCRILAVCVVAVATVALPEVASADMGPGPVDLLGSEFGVEAVAMIVVAVIIVAASVLAWFRLLRMARQTHVEQAAVTEISHTPSGPGDGGGE